jgi:Cys-rich four helix bundle protein (predicted Tat secretion target)
MSNTESAENSNTNLSRRDVLMGLGAVATLAYAGSTLAAMPGHDHSKHSAQQPEALDAVNNCVDKGHRCISHCLVSWNEGDLELAACAKKVNEMNAICEGFSRLLAANSSHVHNYAKICKSVCTECAKECREHDQHIECRECAEACESLVKIINKKFA